MTTPPDPVVPPDWLEPPVFVLPEPPVPSVP
jgi:hypothetical protein